MPGARVLFATGALALICTALAFVIFLALIREVGAPRALVVTYVNPAVALAAGVVVLGEPLTGWNIGGLVLILCGSALATRRSPPSVHPAGAEPSTPQPGPVR
jgi:drug/metabolite transporter (DMT)-like permease